MAYSPYFSAFMQMMMLDYVAQKVTQRKVIHKKIPYSMERHLLLPSHTQERHNELAVVIYNGVFSFKFAPTYTKLVRHHPVLSYIMLFFSLSNESSQIHRCCSKPKRNPFIRNENKTLGLFSVKMNN